METRLLRVAVSLERSSRPTDLPMLCVNHNLSTRGFRQRINNVVQIAAKSRPGAWLDAKENKITQKMNHSPFCSRLSRSHLNNAALLE